MASVNKVMLIGNLGADPEKRFLGSGQAVCNFRIATTEHWKDKQGNKQERTEWHRIVVYGPQAEACEKYLAKGRQVYVEGSVRNRQWEDQQGQKRYITEIIAQRVQFLGGPGGGERTAKKPVEEAEPFPPEEVSSEAPVTNGNDEDIPF